MIHELTPHYRFDLEGEAYLFAAASGSLVGLDESAVRVLDHFIIGEKLLQQKPSL